MQIASRSFNIRREFLEDLEQTRMEETIHTLGRALLVLHAPFDDIVGINNAARIFEAARHPKSFLSLNGADHLLRDVVDAGSVIATWSARYIVDLGLDALEPPAVDPGVVVNIGREKYRTDVRAAVHALVADEPPEVGDGGLGPGPYDFLLSALGTCTAITLRMYADHKGWDLQGVQVHLQHDKIQARDCVD